ncbi:hypothetical protein EVA_12701 [gut metagenome]|uniref:Uncharacterized protein n=1 Tax=gut metagenome TaxID=749906 RepID=J9GBR1_9ZZZZ
MKILRSSKTVKVLALRRLSLPIWTMAKFWLELLPSVRLSRIRRTRSLL